MSNYNAAQNEQNLRDELAEVFGEPLNVRQLWLVAKISKLVRLRAKSNAAFNNLFSRLFPHATFREVQKVKRDGSTYPGLKITVNNESYEGAQHDDGE